MAETVNEVLTAAIGDFAANGYTDPHRLAYWQKRLADAIEADMTPDHVMDEMLRSTLGEVYRKLVDRGDILEMHPGVERFTLERIRPHLHAELQRRIMASADLIKLNREEMKAKTLRRFSGWATSIPAGGSDVVDKRDEKEHIRKGIAGAPYAERRVIVDQGHKLNAAISETVALDTGAIAGRWFSNFRQPGYDARPDHEERDGTLFVVRDNWAMKRGFMRLDGHQYTDEVDGPAVLPFCRCKYRWVFHLQDLPTEMLTKAGKEALAATA